MVSSGCDYPPKPAFVLAPAAYGKQQGPNFRASVNSTIGRVLGKPSSETFELATVLLEASANSKKPSFIGLQMQPRLYGINFG